MQKGTVTGSTATVYGFQPMVRDKKCCPYLGGRARWALNPQRKSGLSTMIRGKPRQELRGKTQDLLNFARSAQGIMMYPGPRRGIV